MERRVQRRRARTKWQIYFDAASDLVVNTPDQPVLAARYQLDGLPLLRMGSREQAVLAKRGDDLRIDWGYLYLAADKAEGVTDLRGRPCAGARRLRRFGHACPNPTNSAKCAAEVRCWPTAIALGKVRAAPGLALPDAGLRRSLRHRVLRAQGACLVAAQWRDGRRPAAQRAPRARCAAGARRSASTPN